MTQNTQSKIINKKKVLFLITKSNWGGAQRYVFDLATSLSPEEFDVVVAAGGKGDLITHLQAQNIRTCSLAHMQNTLSIVSLVGAIIQTIRLLRNERPDLLHTNSSIAGFVGAVAGRCTRTKNTIFTAHGWAFNEDRSKAQKNIFKFFHWLTVMLSDKTIAVSQAIIVQMDWRWVQQKMTVINPGRTITDFFPKSEARGILETKTIDAIANLSEHHTDVWIGTIAELHPIKHLNRAIDSVASISRTSPKVRYVIIGAGECKEKLQQQVRDLGVEEHVFFTGSLYEASRFLKAFDIFVLPSASEAFGYVLLEAGLAHVPVIATNTGGITDIITDQETGLLVPPSDTPALTHAIQCLLVNKTLRAKLADANETNALSHTVERMIEKTTQVYVS
jgi:glycosyltransferase involved in cell wall biosynthesis